MLLSILMLKQQRKINFQILYQSVQILTTLILDSGPAMILWSLIKSNNLCINNLVVFWFCFFLGVIHVIMIESLTVFNMTAQQMVLPLMPYLCLCFQWLKASLRPTQHSICRTRNNTLWEGWRNVRVVFHVLPSNI